MSSCIIWGAGGGFCGWSSMGALTTIILASACRLSGRFSSSDFRLVHSILGRASTTWGPKEVVHVTEGMRSRWPVTVLLPLSSLYRIRKSLMHSLGMPISMQQAW